MRALLFLLHAAVTMLKMAGDAIASALWRLNVYGAIMARRYFDAAELKFVVFNHAKLPEVEYKSLLSSSDLATAYLRESGFSSLLIWKTSMNPSNSFRVALSNRVPRYERIILEKQKQKMSLGLFLMSSNAWKLNTTTECYRLCCQYVLGVVSQKMKIQQSLIVSEISVLFQYQGVRTSLYFYKRGASLKTGQEPMVYGMKGLLPLPEMVISSFTENPVQQKMQICWDSRNQGILLTTVKSLKFNCVWFPFEDVVIIRVLIFVLDLHFVDSDIQ